MAAKNLIADYNYEKFLPEHLYRCFNVDGNLDGQKPWVTGQDVDQGIGINFQLSPSLGAPAPDFPLWTLTGEETSLSAIWGQHAYTVVEFGSFT